MRTSAKFAGLLSICLLLILVFTFSTSPVSENKTPQLLAKANIYNMQFPQEKVYLHLDRSSYWASEDIWFKAYLKDSPIPDCNLYVELLNASGRVIQKKMYWAQGGLAYGDFHLTDTIPTGMYQIRSYTNWMRNFDDCWFFRKDLVIVNLRDKQTDSEADRLKERKIDFQFFPEGGTFVTGIKTKVAFKAADQNGKGLDAEGRIVDDLGHEALKFKSNFKGIGNFMLEPREGRKYTAQVKVAGEIEMNVDLPVSKPEGINMAVNPIDSTKIEIRLVRKSMASTDNSATEYALVGQTKGGVFFRKNIAMVNNAFTLDIKKQDMPTGIIQFTLFDQEAVPVCERLVFINHHDFITVEITSDKEAYLTRERVQLGLQAFDKEGSPYLSNLSLSVFNPESQLRTADYPNNILTHFLLGAELKGLIEDPGYYFKDDSLSTLQALDNLMLTHGYRHFEWEAIREDRFPRITYPAEECIKVRGLVKSILLGKPVPDCSVTMMSVKSLLDIKEQKTDSLGQFLFTDLYFNDTIQYSLQAINKKGKRNTQIELDTASFVSPPFTYLPVTYQYIKENPINTTTWLSESNKDLINKKWHVSDTILLGDINISGTKVKKGDGHIRVYGTADFVLDMKKENDVYGSLFDMLDGQIPGVVLEDKSFYIRGNQQPALLLLDGVPIDADFLVSMPVKSFDKVEVVKYAPMLGSRGNNGAIFFYLKRGQQQHFINPDAEGMKSCMVVGYSVIRKFYAPQYNAQLPTQIKNDFRSTIYWNPIVRTDSLGRARVSFSNIDQAGEVQIVVEGVTADGKLCRGVGKYMVQPKE
ncbi:MAG TPA: hypothetical protein DCL77_18095 [Prolixibacteraceae bacterium]|nr:hypothetical protein [Prolixibacteraceae bacterium]